MAAKVDGVNTRPDKYGIVQGNGGAVDKLSGTAGKDIFQGHAAFNQYYGGQGDDTFKLVAKFANSSGAHQGQSTKFGDQFAYVTDFAGAGVAGGDFIAFDGFKGSTLKMEHKGSTDAQGHTLYYYSVADNAGHVFNFMVNSLTGKELGKGDFAFY